MVTMPHNVVSQIKSSDGCLSFPARLCSYSLGLAINRSWALLSPTALMGKLRTQHVPLFKQCDLLNMVLARRAVVVSCLKGMCRSGVIQCRCHL